MKTFGMKIYGKVQKVGFRKFVLHLAERYGITGWVRNNADGCVEAVCSLNQDCFFEFLKEVYQGSALSEVKQISFYPLEYQEFENFIIGESESE